MCDEKIITGGPLGGHLEKSWLNHLRAKVLYFSAESELLMAEAEKKKDETNIGPQIARLRHADIKIKEAEKASKNPWEDEEWEGLTPAEMYEMMKNELVPAQQARYVTI